MPTTATKITAENVSEFAAHVAGDYDERAGERQFMREVLSNAPPA